MGLLDDFGSFIKTPEGQGLLSATLGGFAGARRGTPWNNVGRAGMAGLLGYQNAQENQTQEQYRLAQIGGLEAKVAAEKREQEAMARIAAGYQADPNFRPNMPDMFQIDPKATLKAAFPGSVGYGLQPKVGINPSTNKPGYFIQDERGGTKWLDAGVPENLQFVPGNEYQASQVFDKSTGAVRPIGAGASAPGGAAGMGGDVFHSAASHAGLPTDNASLNNIVGLTNRGMSPDQAAVQVAGGRIGSNAADPYAPWTKLASPKQQDEMRSRVYEQDRKRLDDMIADVRRGRDMMRDLDRFGELNRDQETGGWLDRTTLPSFDLEKREMEAITARLAPGMRPAGSGTTSDRDLALYLQGLPGIDKPGSVNTNIREQFAEKLTEAEARLAFTERYLIEKGHLQGADEAFAASKRASSGPNVTGLQERIQYFQSIKDPKERTSFARAVRGNIEAMDVDQATKAAILREWDKQTGGTKRPPLDAFFKG